FVQAPMPSALMEKAATTGILAANRLLADWNVRGEDLYTVPLRGIFKAKPALRA
ncbi:MAG TPA: isorenieratene synthase, partial [bacterium]|nr:isorenieratene synthase [bacterium]